MRETERAYRRAEADFRIKCAIARLESTDPDAAALLREIPRLVDRAARARELERAASDGRRDPDLAPMRHS